MASWVFPGPVTTVSTATAGALTGDGTSGNKLAVAVDGVSIDVNGSNQLEVIGDVAPPGSDTQVIFNDGGTALGADAGLVYDKTLNVMTVTGGIAIGATPAATGVVRLTHSDYIYARNSGGTDDIQILGTVAASNDIGLGLDSNVRFGASAAPNKLNNDGSIAMTSNTAHVIYWNNAAIGYSSSGVLELNDGTAGNNTVSLRSKYQSSDGTAGLTTTTTVAGIGVKTITIKDGLITSIA